MSVADLCRTHGISRPTAYRWINRYNETGPEGLVDPQPSPTWLLPRDARADRDTILVLRGQASVLGRAKAQGKAGDAPAGSGVACGQHVHAIYIRYEIGSKESREHARHLLERSRIFTW